MIKYEHGKWIKLPQTEGNKQGRGGNPPHMYNTAHSGRGTGSGAGYRTGTG